MASFALFNFEFEPIQNKLRQTELKGMDIRSRSVPRAIYALIGTLLGAFCIYSSVGILLYSF